MSGTTIYVAGAIDFETTPTLSLTVRVTDSGGLSFTNSFTIAVSNVNERPTSVSLSNLAVKVSVDLGRAPPPFPSLPTLRTPSSTGLSCRFVVTLLLMVQEGVSGATVGTLAAADPDAGATFTFSLASNPNGFFSITGTSLRTAAAISYTAYRSVVVQVGVC